MSALHTGRRLHITSTTTPSELLSQLTVRQCPDLTRELDFNSIARLPDCRGGFGDVYRAKLRNGSEVAIKCLRVYVNTKEGRQVQKMASHEMYAWSKAGDPNVLTLLGVARFQDQLAMISPWMSNGDIMAYLAKHPEANRCELCAQIAKGLAYLHSVGITHGDVKADNVMICENGNAKIGDFGSAKLEVYSLQFSDNLIQRTGTTKFLAPERLRGQGPSAEADVYALGMTILHVISGEPPFKDTDCDAMYMTVTTFKMVPPRPQRSIPNDSEHGDTLWSLLLHCWDQEPGARPGAIGVHESLSGITPDGLYPNGFDVSTVTPSRDYDHEPLPALDAPDITDRLVLSQCSSEPSFSGHMTEIYRGKLDSGTEIAIKCVISTSTPDPSFMKHAAHEMYTWSKVRHKHVLEFLGAALYRNQFAMVSPWMANGNLSRYLSENPGVDRYLMCMQMSEGLAYLHHEGIVHGNLTADNVLVSEDGEAKIADFGSSRLDMYSLIITSESQLGDSKMSWAAPELLCVQGYTKNFKTDMYSFGMTIFQVITTEDPTIQDGIPGSIHMIPLKSNTDPPEESGFGQSEHSAMLWSLLERCWSSYPEDRPDATWLEQEFEKIFRRRKELLSLKNTAITSNPDELLTTGVLSYIIERGCPDLSNDLDLFKSTEYPVSSGGFGDVYKGALKDGQQVAIKCFRSRLGLRMEDNTNRRAVRGIARELYTWSQLKHENVLQLFGVVTYRGSIGLVSPWMKNGSLPQYLSSHPEADRCNLSIQMAEGVTYLHNQNVIHGDLKGLNVLISDAGHALITDFGNTLLNEYSLSLLNSTTSCGVSLRWAAPEILSGEGRRSTESDIYALGMTILEVITGEVPFSGMSDMEVIREVAIKRGIPRRPRRILRHGEDIEESLWSLLENCWMHDPDSRPTASRILASLRTISKDDRSKYAFNYSPVELSQSPEDREELPKAMSDAGGPECHDSRPMFSRPRTPAEPPENSEGVVRRPSWFRRMLAFIRRHLRLLV